MKNTPAQEDLKTKSNEELMRLAQKNVIDAYGIIYERLYGKFINVAGAILKNRSDAEDAAQQALMTGYIKRRQLLFLFNIRYNAYAKTETWLTRILINKAKDIIRKRGRIKKPDTERTEDAVEDQEGARTGEFLDPDIDKRASEDGYQDKKTRFLLMFLKECLKRLSEEEKMNLELREIYEMPYKDIAKIVNEKFGHSSLGNIKNKTDSAKIKVKDCIKKKESFYEIILKNKH